MRVKQFKGTYTQVEIVKLHLEAIRKINGSYITIADYYHAIGRRSRKSHGKKGWKSLYDFKIVETDKAGVYTLVMPKPVPIEVK
jgi:hypothetical protein